MAHINIGTNQGNWQGAEIDKPYDEIRVQDVYAKARKRWAEGDLKIHGWCLTFPEVYEEIAPKAPRVRTAWEWCRLHEFITGRYLDVYTLRSTVPGKKKRLQFWESVLEECETRMNQTNQ